MHCYQILRSKRKTMAIEITRDLNILVRAPLGVGKAAIDCFVLRYGAWIDKAIARQKQNVQRAAQADVTPEKEAELRRMAQRVLPEKIQHYGQLMGVLPAKTTITSAKTRFGSCSGKNRICFSWRLMEKPEAAIDYVVVHELAHLKHKNHGPGFYSFVASVFPDYRERRKLLK